MKKTEPIDDDDLELAALGSILRSLKGLEPTSQQRVMEYVAKKLGLSTVAASDTSPPDLSGRATDLQYVAPPDHALPAGHPPDDEFDGISPVAIKWIRRNGLDLQHLGALFSLGGDEIDLVAKVVPGTSKNSRTRSVALLKCVAAYLSTGAARISGEQLKEACLHYDAYDPPNHAKYLKGLASELSGTKESGFSLTARGLTAATELIKASAPK